MTHTILLIDDEVDIVEILASMLVNEGYDVVTAGDGVEGLAKFKSISPDLVITDVKMPRMDGLEVLRAIKDAGSDVDVIIFTGHSDESTAIECIRRGAYDYLLKPLEDVDVLLVAINRALGKRALEQQNKALLQQLKDLSNKDPLTGLFNYRHLQQRLENEIERAIRYERHFCLFMIDLDNFKAINDGSGHQFGDFVLKEFADLACRTLRTTDIVFRYGGDEFTVLLPETSADDASTAARRLLEATRECRFDADGRSAKLTISIGSAVFDGVKNNSDQDTLIKQADKALYDAKRNGRNRWCAFADEPQADSTAKLAATL